MRRANGLLLAIVFSLTPIVARSAPTHGISLFGDLKYAPEFEHFDYADPQAPKGGTMRLSAFISTFDTLNPFVIKGVAASGLQMIFDTLAVASQDEPRSVYGLVADSIELAADKLSV